ncbi:hypothetical protein L861_15825 [Litchfieldella anticariensis FP35 = DSM 16096]|uniref:Uncharacterized protein n=1 Tax=Litchfieldella anticariensis (strain DSM 16096 / CECT 5854 / CIP 108499 / LMG 22089 / FP35) TaxID=1121939 RepID=S2KJ41_LITA3|nr:hypothetical protein [Halomonas anticariensis]EPC02177.1 hypothetical protein L861_15825 [Halomonas anticariensis FP35 = DSM 16096]
MGGYSLFQMWEPFRQSLIAGQLFYVEQANKRLLSQFDDIKGEADKAAERWLEENSQYFDPDRHDPGEFEERAYDASVEFYGLMCDLREQTKLSVVAGMYHEWEKHLRKWMTGEIRHWHIGGIVAEKVWTVDVGKLVDLLESLGWKIRSQAYFSKLDACRLVVNVYKHGKGRSLNDLKQLYPEYLSDPLVHIGGVFSGINYLDYDHLSVSDGQLQRFSDAIVSFWKDVPENILDREDLEVPGWFAKVMLDDQRAASRQQGGPNL